MENPFGDGRSVDVQRLVTAMVLIPARPRTADRGGASVVVGRLSGVMMSRKSVFRSLPNYARPQTNVYHDRNQRPGDGERRGLHYWRENARTLLNSNVCTRTGVDEN